MPRTLPTLLLILPSTALAQSLAIDMTGLELRHNTNSSRNSAVNPLPAGPAQSLAAAAGFSYNIDGFVRGTAGLLQAQYPNPTPLSQILETIQPGQSRLLRGYVRNLPGSLPFTVYSQTYSGDPGIGTITFTLTMRLDASGTGFIEITNVTLPFGGLIVGRAQVTSGSTTLSQWTPTAPVETEWHFDGSLSEVANSGPSRLRYLDDPAFGPPLRGTSPDPTLPTGITQAQSSFGTTTSFGIPNVNGQVAAVYKTSPTRNLADPTNPDKSRPIGLALWPDTRYFFPEDKIGQWTIIYDILIPASSFSAATPAALLQDTDTNRDDADMFIHTASALGPGIGYSVPFGQYIRTPLLQPDTWLRIALVSDGYSSGTGRMFINGQYLGATGGDWVYNTTDRNSPKYGDGTVVPPATWSAWGQFPSPWALSQGQTGVGMQSIFEIFADDSGDGESVYINNLYFSDTLLTDAQIIALGGPNASGIKFTAPPPCYANCDASTVAPILNVNDFTCFLNLYAAANPAANCDASTTAPILNVNDFTCFINRYAAGCP